MDWHRFASPGIHHNDETVVSGTPFPFQQIGIEQKTANVNISRIFKGYGRQGWRGIDE